MIQALLVADDIRQGHDDGRHEHIDQNARKSKMVQDGNEYVQPQYQAQQHKKVHLVAGIFFGLLLLVSVWVPAASQN